MLTVPTCSIIPRLSSPRRSSFPITDTGTPSASDNRLVLTPRNYLFPSRFLMRVSGFALTAPGKKHPFRRIRQGTDTRWRNGRESRLRLRARLITRLVNAVTRRERVTSWQRRRLRKPTRTRRAVTIRPRRNLRADRIITSSWLR